MAIKILLILFILISKVGLTQNQFGFGLSTGVGSLMFKKELNESPKRTFKAPLDFINPQYKFEFFYVTTSKLNLSVNLSHNNFGMVTRDNSLSVLFITQFSKSGGFKQFSGGSANEFSFSIGKGYGKNRIHFFYSINLFIAKFTREYYTPNGGVGSSYKDGVILYEHSFFPINEPFYSNKMISFGAGFKPQFLYDFKNEKLKLKVSAEINKGFIKIREQSFRTQFISYTEPEKNATYYNTISTKGSNIKFYVGLVYCFDRKNK